MNMIDNNLFDSVHQGRTKLVGSCTEDIIVESLLARYMSRGSCEKMVFVTKSETVGHT